MSTYYGPKIVTDGLVACYDQYNTKSYNGSGSLLFTDMVSGYNGTIVSGSYRGDGKHYYNGNNYTLFTPTTPLDGATSLSIGVWIKFDTMVSAGSIMRKYMAGSQDYYFIIDTSNIDDVEFAIRNSGKTDQLVVATNGAGLTTNKWYYLTIVIYENSGSAMYVNSIPQIQTYTSTMTFDNITETAESLTFGCKYNQGSPDNFGEQQIDMVQLYKNKVLTQTEVLQNYNALKGRYGL